MTPAEHLSAEQRVSGEKRAGDRFAAIVLVGYLVLAATMLSRTWLGGDLEARLVGGGGDPLGFVWFLAWLPHAISAGVSPLFTTSLMAPQGANLMNSTAISLPSFLLWPVTAAFGPTVSYDVLATLAIALSAWGAFFAFRRLARHRSSAWLGGLIYGFSPYIAGQASAHVNLMVAVFPPLVAILIDELRREPSQLRAGLLLGLCSALQVYVNEEILALTAILVALALIVVALAKRPARETITAYARPLLAGAIVFAALAGPALAYQLAGPQHVSGADVSSGRYVNDLASFFVPSSLQALSTPASRHLTSGFSGFDGEWGAYIGIPLAVLLAFAAWRLRRRALPAALLLGASALFSLGPHLRIHGHDTGVLLPWVIPSHLPLLQNVVPDRFNLFLWLAAAALVVMLIDELRARPLLGSRLLSVAAVGLALVPIVPALSPSERVSVPPMLASASAFHRALPHAHTVLIAPTGDGQFAMYAQVRSQFAFRIPDGGVFVPSPNGPAYGMRDGPLRYALDLLARRPSTLAGRTTTDSACLEGLEKTPSPSGSCRTYYRRAIGALGVDAVIVYDLGSRSAMRCSEFFAALLGRPRELDGVRIFG